MGVITHFCTCCFIFKLFLQLIEERNSRILLICILSYIIRKDIIS
uniref:PsbL n=1 Tax=Angelica tsinlingensis TaxID=357858 RepID=A0A2L1K1D9_9APIA|nr:PsbL [Angelica tsinlingensis]